MITIALAVALWFACGLYAFILWQDYAEFSNEEVQTWSGSFFFWVLLKGPYTLWTYYRLKRDLEVIDFLRRIGEKEE